MSIGRDLLPNFAIKEFLITPKGFLNRRKLVDGAEGLWRIKNSLYDLTNFAKNHPGGEEWIQLTKGTDITEVFETHHLTNKAEKLLPKFYVREAAAARSIPITFEPNGFYRKFKERAREALRNVDFHKPAEKTNRIADLLAISTFALALTAASTRSWLFILAASVCLNWTTIIGHNYFHLRDNFRMYYFDLSIMSSKDWRITHVMSHHMYPNTTWDYEVYAMEPFLDWSPRNKTNRKIFLGRLFSPLLWSLVLIQQGVKRFYSIIFEYRRFEFRDFVPFSLPLAMCLTSSSFATALQIWLIIILITSFLFGMIGVNAAHHHPDIFHEGDIVRDNLDWGLLELDTVRDRKIIDDSLFLVVTNFGSHGLHHLLPTIDHFYLPLCWLAFYDTCKEFGIGTDKFTSWELFKGQFQQLGRIEAKNNTR